MRSDTVRGREGMRRRRHQYISVADLPVCSSTKWLCLSTLVYWSWFHSGLGSISVFEGLHQGRILCSSVANEHTLLTGGDSMVRPCVSCGAHQHCLLSVRYENPLHCTSAGQCR